MPPRTIVSVAFAVLLIALGTATAVRGWAADPPPAQQVPVTPWPDPVATMQYHFVQVTRVHEAVIRGDLPAAKSAADELATMALPEAQVEGAGSIVDEIRSQARRVADATTLATAASATAMMLRQCGVCHLRVARPGIADPPPTIVGGIVGHMLEHQAGLDQLLQGLVIPSATLWSQGAERLQGEPLPDSQFPPDPGLTGDIQRAEARVHRIAEMAASAQDPVSRGAAYSELLVTCAECHRLHGRVWGPSSISAGGGAGRGGGS